MLYLDKIRKDLNWVIAQIKCIKDGSCLCNNKTPTLNFNTTTNVLTSGHTDGTQVSTTVPIPTKTSDLVNNGNGVSGQVFITSADIPNNPVYTLSPISGTNTVDLLKDGVSVSQINLTQYLDDTNLARLVNGTLNTAGILTVTRNDNTTFDIDLSALLPQNLPADVNTWDLPGVAFVSPSIGNDTTAVIGDGNKPYKTVNAASQSGANKVLLKPGNYTEFVELSSGIEYISMKGVNFISGRIAKLFGSNQNVVWKGFAKFSGSFQGIVITAEGNFFFEVQKFDNTQWIISAQNSANVTLHIHEGAVCHCFNGAGYAILCRSNAKITIFSKYLESQHGMVNMRIGNPTVILVCPNVTIRENYHTKNFGNINKYLVSGGTNDKMNFVLIGNCTNVHPTISIGTGDIQGLIYLLQHSTNPASVFIKGDLKGGAGPAIVEGFNTSTSNITVVEGIISSNVEPILTTRKGSDRAGKVTIKLKNCTVVGARENIIGQGTILEAKSCTFKSTRVDPAIVNFNINTDHSAVGVPQFYFWDCDIQSDTVSSPALFNTNLLEFYCKNSMGNVPKGTAVVDVWNGYTEQTNFKVIDING